MFQESMDRHPHSQLRQLVKNGSGLLLKRNTSSSNVRWRAVRTSTRMKAGRHVPAHCARKTLDPLMQIYQQ